MFRDKTYLGDSVYAVDDGYMVTLTTENGYEDDPRNKICLESDVIEALINFISHTRNLTITVVKNEPQIREEEI